MTTTTPPQRTASAPRGRLATLRVLAVVAVLCMAAVGAIVHLNANAEASTRAELRAVRDGARSRRPAGRAVSRPARERRHARRWHGRGCAPDEARVWRTLGRAPGQLAARTAPQRADPDADLLRDTLHDIYAVGVSKVGYGPLADRLGAVSGGQLAGLTQTIDAAGRAYAARAQRTRDDVLVGSGLAIALLFCAFAFFQHRAETAKAVSERLADENWRLLDTSREEARTDALTGLANRRALIADLTAVLDGDCGRRAILILFDLDGFKQYNDSFGHPAGDMLLQRLGARLRGGRDARWAGRRTGWAATSSACSPRPRTRSGRCGRRGRRSQERGDAFEVGSSYGVAELPDEASSVAMALHVADVRLYDDKASGRPSADRQTTDVLMALISERGAHLLEHVERVSDLTELCARRMGLSDSDTRQAALAARLHDVGKAAIPDAIVSKPGTLDAAEWEFIHRHTVIGEQIIAAAPALARWPRSCARATSDSTAPAIPTACAARRSRSPRGSSACATPTTR